MLEPNRLGSMLDYFTPVRLKSSWYILFHPKFVNENAAARGRLQQIIWKNKYRFNTKAHTNVHMFRIETMKQMKKKMFASSLYDAD